MKKNGFTLVELIATMVLIALLATVVLINTTGIKSNQDEASSSRFVSTVEQAACTFIDLSINADLRQRCKNDSSLDECKISLATLIRDDVALIDEDLKDPATNKLVSEEKDDIYVQVTFKQDGSYKVKSCEFKRK